MPGTIDVKERQRQQWGAVAPEWDKLFEWYSRSFRPLIDWACTAIDLTPGMRILDVACGSGQPALEAASRVRPGGTVVATDISSEMVNRATRRAQALNIDNADFQVMDAEDLRFGDATFDGVTCSCGLMFMPDVMAALTGMHRVLKHGCRFAFAVWDAPAKSSFITVGGGSVAKFFPPAPADPRTVGGFRFGSPGDFESVLRDAGFRDIRIESLPIAIDFGSTEEYWQVFSGMAAGSRDKIATLSDAESFALRKTVDEAARPYIQNGRLSLTATPLCASGRK